MKLQRLRLYLKVEAARVFDWDIYRSDPLFGETAWFFMD